MSSEQELIDIIKRKLDEGLGEDEIRETLLSDGYAAEDVGAAFSSLQIPKETEGNSRILTISDATNEGRFSFSSFLSLFIGNKKK